MECNLIIRPKKPKCNPKPPHFFAAEQDPELKQRQLLVFLWEIRDIPEARLRVV